MPATTVVFAAIDGVLGASSRGAFALAARTLASLLPTDVRIVLHSARTRNEIHQVYEALQCRHPFICEGGSAVVVPDGCFPFDIPDARSSNGCYVVEWGWAYADVAGAVRRAAEQAHVEIASFSGLSVDQMAIEYGLSPVEAALAGCREYSELFQITAASAASQARFALALSEAGLHLHRGHRYHRAVRDVDATNGVSLLLALYRRAHGNVTTIGFADCASDPFLLNLVDRPVMIERRTAGSTPSARAFEAFAVYDIAQLAAAVSEMTAHVRAIRDEGPPPFLEAAEA